MLRFPILILAVLSITGCVQNYAPVSSLESSTISRSKRDIYPDDFRKSAVPLGSTEVAWAGIILDSKVDDTGNQYNIALTIQHHYYDWVIDNKRMHLSPRGEGIIKTKWTLVKQLKPEIVANVTKSGNMIVIYGVPESLESDVLIVRATYLRTFAPGAFTTDTLDYGRPGEGSLKPLKPLY